MVLIERVETRWREHGKGRTRKGVQGRVDQERWRQVGQEGSYLDYLSDEQLLNWGFL